MASIWITYAWNDNKDQDIDFIAQELRAVGLTVKLVYWFSLNCTNALR